MKLVEARDATIHAALCRLADPLGPPRLESLRDLTPADFRRFLTIARVHRVLGIVLEKVDSLNSVFTEQLAEARRCHRAEIAQSLRVRDHGQKLLNNLAEAGIPVALLKGADFADALYPRPRVRPTCDVDLFVPRAAWQEAIKVLLANGHEEKTPQPPMQLPTGPAGEYTWIRKQDPPIEVDLHWNLINLPSFREDISIEFDDLPWDSGHGPSNCIRQAMPTSRLLIAAVHATYQHQFDRLLLLSDLAQALRKLDGCDPAELRSLAATTRAGLALDIGLRATQKFFGVSACKDMEREVICKTSPLPSGELPSDVLEDITTNLRAIQHHFNTPARRRFRNFLRGWGKRLPGRGEADPERTRTPCTPPL